jgi:hypothetical protein
MGFAIGHRKIAVNAQFEKTGDFGHDELPGGIKGDRLVFSNCA